MYLDEPTASPGEVAPNIWTVLSHPLAAHPLTPYPLMSTMEPRPMLDLLDTLPLHHRRVAVTETGR